MIKKQVKKIKKNLFHASISELTGNILEIGFGKGETFKHYNNNCTVNGIEKNQKFLKFKKETNCKLILQQGHTENMPYEDNYFDAVVGSFVLCSVDSVEKSVQEINRVLKKGGTLILIEHIKSNSKFFYRVQEFINKIHLILNSSCRLTRDPRFFIKENGFRIISENLFLNSIEPYLYLKAEKM